MDQETMGASRRFDTPEEELEFLRAQVAQKERDIANLEGKKIPETLAVESNSQPVTQIPEVQGGISPSVEAEGLREEDSAAGNTAIDQAHEVDTLLHTLHEKGIKSSLGVAEQMNQPDVSDDFHRTLIQQVKEGEPVEGVKTDGPIWGMLHMTLYEVSFPRVQSNVGDGPTYRDFISAMEQFYAGMLSVNDGNKTHRHIALEIAVANKSDEIIFYVAMPDSKRDLFEKQSQALFPQVQLSVVSGDYNIFIPGGVAVGMQGTYERNAIFPIKTHEAFENDPLDVVLNAFSKIEHEGGGAALQILFSPPREPYLSKYRGALEQIQKGVPVKKAIDISFTVKGEAFRTAREIFAPKPKPKSENTPVEQPVIDTLAIQNIQNKMAANIVNVNIRIVAAAGTEARAQEIVNDISSAFNQFEHTQSNKLVFKNVPARKRARFLRMFSFREFSIPEQIPLNLKELTTIMHFTAYGTTASPQFKEGKAGSAPAPVGIPQDGTLLGINQYRQAETKAYLTKEDRLRHLYVIGQTGTGKTTFLKNMIAQDIREGDGVCMIDPHGTDIQDVLSIIPPERHEDVIYFDPSRTDRVLALNMLEYDPRFPEQKTFVVNELFSIFQKLYGDNPESMGPMFEQYFRNATMLVLEDPDTGCTLLDVSRVFADENYRNLKIARCRNPVVVQFWKDIATKAGGEGSLANIAPYITSKFDVFMSNDIMRPLIAQEKSSFNMRRVMDERKILLVNLSRGRLGDINANLIGLIIVGKILMSALSRVDSYGKTISPFYLYIDEFQNITTDSISSILSEARKYKLGLTMAHQFIAQLDEGIRDAVFGNVGSIAAFRVGSEDAQFLERQFEPIFSSQDLMNIENHNAYVRLLLNGTPAKPFNISILPPSVGEITKVEALKEQSYQAFGRDRRDVEESIKAKYH